LLRFVSAHISHLPTPPKFSAVIDVFSAQISQLDSEEGGFGLVVSQRARQSVLVPGNVLVNPAVARPLEKAGEEEQK
jgi:hypothetical protein